MEKIVKGKLEGFGVTSYGYLRLFLFLFVSGFLWGSFSQEIKQGKKVCCTAIIYNLIKIIVQVK